MGGKDRKSKGTGKLKKNKKQNKADKYFRVHTIHHKVRSLVQVKYIQDW